MKPSYTITIFIVIGILSVYGFFEGAKETSSAITPSPMYSRNPKESSHWFLADVPSPNAVVLLIHGLNQKPSMWKDMIVFLNSLGAHVYRLTLKGHGGGPFEDMTSVTADAWRQNVIDAYNDMDSRFHDIPKILVGYSTGALVALDYQLIQGHVCFAKQILFAPAIALQDYTFLLKPLTYLASYLPSQSPEAYRANFKGTAMAAYRAMFKLLDKVENTGDYQAINTDTLIFINPEDELIDYEGLIKLREVHHLDTWIMAPILNQKTDLEPATRHLIIDSMSLGRDGWTYVTSTMNEFYRKRNHATTHLKVANQIAMNSTVASSMPVQ